MIDMMMIKKGDKTFLVITDYPLPASQGGETRSRKKHGKVSAWRGGCAETTSRGFCTTCGKFCNCTCPDSAALAQMAAQAAMSQWAVCEKYSE